MIDFDAASLLLQWATGGLLFLWVTTRRREVGLGYGWLMRGVYLAMAAGAWYVGTQVIEPLPVRDAASAGVVLASGAALAVSIVRGRGVGQIALAEKRSARVAAMTGIDRPAADAEAKEFPPVLDLIAPVIGAWASSPLRWTPAARPGWPSPASSSGRRSWGRDRRHVARALVPGAARPGPLLELVKWCGWLWIPEVFCCSCTGMVSVSTAPSTTTTTASSAGSGSPAPSPPSGCHHHPVGPEGARLLGRHGGHRPALPGYPHRVWHRSGGSGATVVTSWWKSHRRT